MIAGTDNKREVNQYINGVLSGDIVSCRTMKQAMQRHVDDLEIADERGYYFSEKIASNSIDFFPIIKHIDGEYAGKPFHLVPFQKAITWIVCGWRRKSDDCRRFREVLIQMARGNGKTPWAAAWALMLYQCDFPLEANPKVYTTATKRDQAMLSFKTAKQYAEQPAFQKWITSHKYELLRDDGGEFTALSCDGKTADGLQIHGLIRDELHAWRHTHEEFVEKLQTAAAKRKQPLLLTITTAGDEDSQIWIDEDRFCRDLLDGNTPADYKAVFIFETDELDDILDPEVWPKANPMLEHGVVKLHVLQDMAVRAKMDPNIRNAFQRYHCNRIVSSNETVIDPDRWRACKRWIPDMSDKECYAGFDWGSVDDLTAIAYVFPLDAHEGDKREDRRFAVLCDCFIPSHGKHDIKRDPWRTWIDNGELIVTDGEVTSGAQVMKVLTERSEQYAIKSLAFDLANCRDIALRAEDELGLATYAMPQKPSKFNEAFEEVQRAIKSERLEHNGDSLLEWAAKNVVAQEDSNGNQMPSKRKSMTKIDPFVAMVMGVNEMLFATREPESIWEEGPIDYMPSPWAVR